MGLPSPVPDAPVSIATTVQISQGSPSRLATAKTASDTLVQPLEPRRPLQHVLLLQYGLTHNQPPLSNNHGLKLSHNPRP